MYRSLLVPLDGSAFAEHALPLALAVARRAGAALRLVTVVTPLAEAYAEGVYFTTLDLQAEVKEQQRAYVEGVAARLAGAAVGPVSTAVLEGEVATTLCEHARQVGPDLVVMATHGRGALGRFWLGSVADELLRHRPTPLLLVRPEDTAADLSAEPALGRVLLPLDGSELAERILEPAAALAALTPGAEVTLLRVVQPLAPGTPPDDGGAENEGQALFQQIQAAQRHQKEEAEAYLGRVAERLRARGLRVVTRVAVEEQPAVAILKEAERHGDGLIALETHGRRGLSRLILGSVADKVIRGAHVPVLVGRPHEGTSC